MGAHEQVLASLMAQTNIAQILRAMLADGREVRDWELCQRGYPRSALGEAVRLGLIHGRQPALSRASLQGGVGPTYWSLTNKGRDVARALLAYEQGGAATCDVCGGHGWLYVAEPDHGHSCVPAIQRCDTCWQFESDPEAALAFVRDTGIPVAIRNRYTGEHCSMDDEGWQFVPGCAAVG